MLESLRDLDEQLKEFIGSFGLWIFRGKPEVIFRKLHEKLGINKICFEKDCEPIWKERDEKVKNLCSELKISVVEKVSHTLYDPNLIISANGGFGKKKFL